MTKVIQFLKVQRITILLVLIIVTMSFASPYFLTKATIINILLQTSLFGIMACGMSFAIIGAEFDLSVGSIMSLCGLLSIQLSNYMNQITAIIIAMVIGCFIGLLNGLLVSKGHISSFIVTIGTMGIVKGIALKISGGTPIISDSKWFGLIGSGTLLGIPNLLIIFLLVILISAYCLKRTRFGRNVYTIGGSMEVAHNSGINVNFYKTAIFMISAFTAALAGILLASRLNTGSALLGDNAALSVISGVVIGGTSLSGGVGSIYKSVTGMLVITLITISLDLLGIYSYYQTAIRGLLLVLIIGLGAYEKYQKGARSSVHA